MLHPYCLDSSGWIIISYSTEHYHTMYTVTHCLPVQYLRETICVHKYLPLTLVGHAHSQWSWNVKPMKFCPFFQQDGVLPGIMCDNTKEMIQGEMNRKLKEASCHLRQSELFTPWSNASKREMNELKKGFSSNLIRSRWQKNLGW